MVRLGLLGLLVFTSECEPNVLVPALIVARSSLDLEHVKSDLSLKLGLLWSDSALLGFLKVTS